MNVFKGFKNITLKELDHSFIGSGHYGPGVYLALNLTSAEGYSGGDTRIVTEYVLDDSNLLLIRGDVFKKFGSGDEISLPVDLKTYFNKPVLPSTKLTESLRGYSGMILKGRVEGGEQVILKDSSHLTLSRIHIGQWIFSEDLAERFSNETERLFNCPLVKRGGHYWFMLDPNQLEAAASLIEFHDSLSLDIMEINYQTRSVTYFEED